MTNPVNPGHVYVTDQTATAEGVVSFRIQFGQTPGGPYPLTAADIPLSATTAATAPDTGLPAFAIPLSDFTSILKDGQWYCVAEAVTALTQSKPSAQEASFIIATVPSAPTGFIAA